MWKTPVPTLSSACESASSNSASSSLLSDSATCNLSEHRGESALHAARPELSASCSRTVGGGAAFFRLLFFCLRFASALLCCSSSSIHQASGSETCGRSSSCWTSYAGSTAIAHSACSTRRTNCCSSAATEAGSLAKMSFHRARGAGVLPIDAAPGLKKSGKTCLSASTKSALSKKLGFIANTGNNEGSTSMTVGSFRALPTCQDKVKAAVNKDDDANWSWAAPWSRMPIWCISACFSYNICKDILIVSTTMGSSKDISA
mmetsp:Transcript_30473/g.84959  ORF Transcript_30473/g.84959 Transcript_30473/m.84959 type:complete len:260 (+) Transcript_30473:630-1409(+)